MHILRGLNFIRLESVHPSMERFSVCVITVPIRSILQADKRTINNLLEQVSSSTGDGAYGVSVWSLTGAWALWMMWGASGGQCDRVETVEARNYKTRLGEKKVDTVSTSRCIDRWNRHLTRTLITTAVCTSRRVYFSSHYVMKPLTLSLRGNRTRDQRN